LFGVFCVTRRIRPASAGISGTVTSTFPAHFAITNVGASVIKTTSKGDGIYDQIINQGSQIQNCQGQVSFRLESSRNLRILNEVNLLLVSCSGTGWLLATRLLAERMAQGHFSSTNT
jgi:hypothetical protein